MLIGGQPKSHELQITERGGNGDIFLVFELHREPRATNNEYHDFQTVQEPYDDLSSVLIKCCKTDGCSPVSSGFPPVPFSKEKEQEHDCT